MCMRNWLKKFNAIQTTGTSDLVQKIDYNIKIENTTEACFWFNSKTP